MSWIPTNQDPTGSQYNGSENSAGVAVYGSYADYPSKLFNTDEVYYGNAIKTQMGNAINNYMGGYMANYSPYYIATVLGGYQQTILGIKSEMILGGKIEYTGTNKYEWNFGPKGKTVTSLKSILGGPWFKVVTAETKTVETAKITNTGAAYTLNSGAGVVISSKLAMELSSIAENQVSAAGALSLLGGTVLCSAESAISLDAPTIAFDAPEISHNGALITLN